MGEGSSISDIPADRNDIKDNDPAAITAATDESPTSPSDQAFRLSWRFALVFVSQCLTVFATALEATITVTALSTVTRSIGATQTQYVWIANSFLLASVAVQPAVAQASDVFGRRWPLMGSIALFVAGSGIAGGAASPAMLLAGRTVQGIGAGGSFVLVDIVTSDLVPQRRRGPFMGVVFAMAGVGATLGPLIGGALADASWRWIYYIMLPVGGFALVAEFLFLRLKHERQPDWRSALVRVDWVGSAIFIPSIVAIMLALVMGGVQFPWGSYHIVVPLVLGFLGWIGYHVYEASPWCREPSTPPLLFTNRTSSCGFIIAFIAAMLLEWIFYFMPLYFQGALGTSAFQSGVHTLPLAVIMLPSAIVSGIVMTITGKYKPLHWASFAFLSVGTGVFSLLNANSSTAAWAGFQVIATIGLGLTMSSVLPAIQSSLPESRVASSTGTYAFLRSFGMVWGVVIPSTIFNHQVNSKLDQVNDESVRRSLSNGGAFGFATDGSIRALSPQLQSQIRNLYADALRPVWYAAAAFAAVGFFVVFVEKAIPLRTDNNTQFGLEEERRGVKAEDAEKSPSTSLKTP